MHLTDREWWGLIHGMGFGALFLLAFAGGLAPAVHCGLPRRSAAGATEPRAASRWGYRPRPPR